MIRRTLLKSLGGLGVATFASMLDHQMAWGLPTAAKVPHFTPKAKRVIFLCMRGGPSHMETFDYKPKLQADNGKPGKNKNFKLLGSRWKFSQHGPNGTWVVDLLPQTAKQADKFCVIRSMTSDSENHPQALEQLHTGSFQFVRPSLGSWTVHGLGTENQNLPGFISINPLTVLGGLRYYSNAFLPAANSATLIGEAENPDKSATVGNLADGRLSPADQRKQLDLLGALNAGFDRRAGNHQGKDVTAAFELAFRMQKELPTLMDLGREAKETLKLYGVDQGPSNTFGRQCLLARRLSEAGVRFVEVTHTDWDHHGFLGSLMPARCKEIDQPVAGLLADLHARGLLKDTLVVWAGEFGRTPDDPTADGRGHNSKGFSIWMAGGGVKGGLVYGRTDDHGYEAVENKVHVHDLHATILHLLGLDHEKLTYKHGGRDYRLTDVYGNVVKGIM
jgi:hypothetical protein